MTWTITPTNLLPDDADAVAYIAADCTVPGGDPMTHFLDEATTSPAEVLR